MDWMFSLISFMMDFSGLTPGAVNNDALAQVFIATTQTRLSFSGSSRGTFRSVMRQKRTTCQPVSTRQSRTAIKSNAVL